jgi:squalene cyclase
VGKQYGYENWNDTRTEGQTRYKVSTSIQLRKIVYRLPRYASTIICRCIALLQLLHRSPVQEIMDTASYLPVTNIVTSVASDEYLTGNVIVCFAQLSYPTSFSVDRLCGPVVRVPGYRSRGPGSIQDFVRSSGSRTGFTHSREYS